MALLLGISMVMQEKERGTAALMLAKPLSRGAFLAAKAVALGLSFAIGIALAGAGGYYYTALLFGAPNAGGWLALNALLTLFMWVYVSWALLCSTVSRSQVMAGALAFGGMVVLSVLGSLPGLAKYTPNGLINWGANLALNMSGTGWPALGVSAAIIVLSLLAAWAVFQRQEL